METVPGTGPAPSSGEDGGSNPPDTGGGPEPSGGE